MARNRSISDEQILAAARALVLERGAKVSTADIARAAGVSEGTIFNRFATKDDLIRAALGSPAFDAEGLVEVALKKDSVQAGLETIAEALITHIRELMPRQMMAWAHHAQDPIELFKDTRKAPTIQLLKAVTHFFDQHMAEGRIRIADPEVAARVLLGSLYNYVFFDVMGVHLRLPISAPTYLRCLLDILWTGLDAPQNGRDPSCSS